MSKTAINLVICSKPLQWFNASNIGYPDNTKRYLIIVGGFSESEDFYKKLKEYDSNWEDVILTGNREESCAAALKLAEQFTIEKLYVDCDYGTVGNNYAKLPAKEFYVYEEGFGPYVNLIDNSLKGTLKKVAFKILGMAEFLGAHKRTNGIYVHNPAYYKSIHTRYSKKVMPFKEPFYVALQNKDQLMDKISSKNEAYSHLSGKRVMFYITRYTLNEEIIRYIESQIDQFDYVIIKLHPHKFDLDISEFVKNIPENKLIVLRNSTLAEVIISKLSINNELTIVHEGSSSCLYVDERRVKVINMDKEYNEEFTIFKKMYLETL